ncbi:MAG TPA: hypothetical protein VFS75_00570 [Candidatus Paceibacterota bacterium]|nr:hypothetical protein [Candidatus Paceibacterota bacterium]
MCIILLSPMLATAKDLNVDFVQGVWFSQEPVFVGVPTRVYVAFRNNTESDLTGTIRFLDNGKQMGSSDISVLRGRIVEAWTDWTPTTGNHTITVTMANAALHEIGKEPAPIDIEGIATEDAVTVDYDTDGDGIGNASDTDDDGDGISDIDEKARGSDPLTPNPTPVATTTTSAPLASTTAPAGLEEFLPDGKTSDALRSVTDGLTNVKSALDAYRRERNAQLADVSTTTPLDTATITRSKIEGQKTFLGGLVAGTAYLLKNLYTFALYALSRALTYPAMVELAVLLGLLLTIYRFARRVGRRPGWD